MSKIFFDLSLQQKWWKVMMKRTSKTGRLKWTVVVSLNLIDNFAIQPFVLNMLEVEIAMK